MKKLNRKNKKTLNNFLTKLFKTEMKKLQESNCCSFEVKNSIYDPIAGKEGLFLHNTRINLKKGLTKKEAKNLLLKNKVFFQEASYGLLLETFSLSFGDSEINYCQNLNI